MNIFVLLTIILIGLAVFFIRKTYTRKKGINIETEATPESSWKSILEEKVPFYNELSNSEKERFYTAIKDFLAEVRITPVKGVTIEDKDRLLVAASAIIPVFSFPDWEYFNIEEVLVYDGDVDTRQKEEETKGRILGQVRPFQSRHLVLFSKQSLQHGFASKHDKGNVGLHEFAHMIDQADGDVDGVPKAVMPPELIRPWSDLMYKEIDYIKKGQSDINPYGLKNEAEFFAVVCEYFFENPEKFEKKHPDLYALLVKTFKRKQK